jgi:DNA-binding response OmpR family regulator
LDEGITERVVGDLCSYAIDAVRRSRSPTISTKPVISTGERHLVLVAGKPRRLTPNFRRLFTLIYRHRGDVVDNDRIQAELYDETEELAANAVRENVRRLRRALGGSRYEIVNHPTLGYELIAATPRCGGDGTTELAAPHVCPWRSALLVRK